MIAIAVGCRGEFINSCSIRLPTGALSVIVGETDNLDNLWMQLWCKVFYRKIYFYILAR